MYQNWSPPPRNRKALRQLELKKRRLKRRFWELSASICLFSFVFIRHEGTNYQHIITYLPQEVKENFSHIHSTLSREVDFFTSFMKEYSYFSDKSSTSLTENPLTSEAQNTETTPKPTEYLESIEIFAHQGTQLHQEILGWMEPNDSVQDSAPEEPEPTDCEPVPEEAAIFFTLGEILEYFPSDLPESHSENFYFLGDITTVSPVINVVTSTFGLRNHPTTGIAAIHNGVDLRSTEGTPISAWREGVVSKAGFTALVGNYVRIDHGNEIYSFYAHCSEISVHQGDFVEAGQTIGKVGATGDATGPHLHFEITYNGIYLNPLHYIEYSGFLE